MFYILITGSRDWRNPYIIRDALLPYIQEYGAANITLIHGKARGADTIAGLVAKRNGIKNIHEYPAKWDIYGDSAGPIRNQEMLDKEPQIDICLAFPLQNSIGTWDMIERAKEKNIEVIIWKG